MEIVCFLSILGVKKFGYPNIGPVCRWFSRIQCLSNFALGDQGLPSVGVDLFVAGYPAFRIGVALWFVLAYYI